MALHPGRWDKTLAQHSLKLAPAGEASECSFLVLETQESKRTSYKSTGMQATHFKLENKTSLEPCLENKIRKEKSPGGAYVPVYL